MMENIPLIGVTGIFICSVLAILFAGWRLATTADKIADATGLGEAITGALLLGATTSLPGLLTSAVTASNGFASLAFSNAVGGIAAQTMFLAIADISYRTVNLEHAAASASNMMQAALLIALLTLPLLAMGTPSLSVFQIHPISFVIPCVYIGGLRMISRAQETATWVPEETPETIADEPQEDQSSLSMQRLVTVFLLMAAIVAAAGWVVAEAGMTIVERTGLSESVVGGVFTAVATSVPELVTTLAAVRIGALTLAVGNILGGNSFDTLFLAVADIAYREGSLYQALGQQQLFLLSVSLLMSAVLILGLLGRQKKGIANIGFESLLLLLLYGGLVLQLFRS